MDAGQGRLFQRLLEQCPVAVLVTDTQGRIVYVNPHFTRLTGYSREQVLGRTPALLRSGNTPPQTYQNLWKTLKSGQAWRGEFQNRRPDGTLYSEAAIITPIHNAVGTPTHYLGLFDDLGERKRAERLFEQLAYHDSLTGLPNQSLYHERLELALVQARKAGQVVAVMLLDLDRFKLVNETLGHLAGDQLIRLVGERLSAGMRPGDTVARRGGGEFMLLLPGLEHFREASQRAQAILDSLKAPFRFNSREVFLTASLGVSLFPEDGSDGRGLLQNADSALYDAKEAGRNVFKFFKVKYRAAPFERLALENSFRHSLELHQFRVFYQPQIDLRTGGIVGMEALVRWQHPEHGLLAPDTFIPLAEETGLIVPLGQWILNTACAQTRSWHRQGFTPLRVAINLSARQFQEPELVESVLKVLKKNELSPEHLELELTESILMKDVDITTMLLRWLSKNGIRIAIDDFGTGYSSLMYLKRFPISTLKIDSSFIRDMLTNEDSAALVTAINSMAQTLKLRVVAEGVETEEQLEFLRGLNCDEIQGFLFSRPVPPEEFTELLRSGRRLPAVPA